MESIMTCPSHRLLLLALVLAPGLRGADPAAFQVRIDVRDAKGKPFAGPSQALCQEWYPKIHASLFGAGYPLPFPEVKVVLESSIAEGIWPFRTVIPAYTERNIIHVNSEYVSELHQQDPDDYAGMLIHELTHVDQHYGNTGDAGWLVEGIADYVRHKYFAKDIEPLLHLDAKGNLQGFELDRNKGSFAEHGYLAGYTVTGAFLYWLEQRKDKDIVPMLNRALREGRYSARLFQQRCGAPLDALWREFVAQSRAVRV
jgi:Peptidase of plants and bacteria